MAGKTPKDKRDKLWAKLERDIQSRGHKKDRRFSLTSSWKTPLEKLGKFKIFVVDGEWVRNNLSVIFGHGGHGLVHEFIPLDEIWVDSHHHKSCSCKKVKKNRKASDPFMFSTVVHEIVEYQEMVGGKNYWQAHNIALQSERDMGVLKDPHEEVS
ncbi:MAG: hypothetical protein Q8Q37_00880 [bacterium]|nr:hypothetical protein [bacterium]